MPPPLILSPLPTLCRASSFWPDIRGPWGKGLSLVGGETVENTTFWIGSQFGHMFCRLGADAWKPWTAHKHFLSKCLSLVKEQRATSQAIAESLDHLKSEALQLGEQICEEVTVVEEKCDSNNLDQYDKEALTRRMREILLQCYRFCFEVKYFQWGLLFDETILLLVSQRSG